MNPWKTLILAHVVSACISGPGFMKSKGGVLTATADGIKAPVQSDQDGVLTAAVSANTSLAQTVNASKADSSISNASVTFPPGALAISTTVTIEQGSALAAPAFASELGLDKANSISSAGTAVVIKAASNVNAVTPFTVALPLDGSAGLEDVDPSLLVVIYRCWDAATNTFIMGVIPRSQLTVSNKNTLQFSTVYFGQYQAAYTSLPITTRVKANSTAAPLSKAAEKTLAPVSWQGLSADFDATRRVVKVSAAASGFTTLSACGFVLSQSMQPPYQFTAPVGAAASGEAAVGDLPVGTYYAQVSCNETNGRSSTSPWSAAVAITGVLKTGAGPSAPTPSSSPTIINTPTKVTTVSPGDGTTAQSLLATVFAVFDLSLASRSSADWLPFFHLTVNNTDDAASPPPATAPYYPGIITQPDTITLSFTPSVPYPLLTRMTAQVLPGVPGVNGAVTTTSKQWSFMTADGAWSAAADARTPLKVNATATAVTTAVGSGGDVAAIQADGNSLAAYYLPAGATAWQSTYLDTAHTIGAAQALVDDVGNVYVLWISKGTPTPDPYNLYLAVFTKATGTWSASLQLDTVSSGSQLAKPQMALYGGHQLRFLWYTYAGGVGTLKTNTYNAVGGSLGTPATVSGATGVAAVPGYMTMAVNAYGDYLIAYSPAGSLLYARYSLAHGQDVQTAAEPEQLLADANDQLVSLQAGIDADGHSTLLYNVKNSTAFANKLVAQARQNATWTSTTLNSMAYSGTNLYSPVLAVAADGRVRAAWYDTVRGLQTTATTAAGAAWQSPAMVIDGPGSFDTTSHLLLVANAQGDAALAWGTPTYSYYGLNLSVGQTVAATPYDVLDGLSLTNLSLVIDNSGNATMLGNYPGSGVFKIYASRVARGQSVWPAMSSIQTSTDPSFRLWPVSSLAADSSTNAASVDRQGRVYYTTTDAASLGTAAVAVNLFK